MLKFNKEKYIIKKDIIEIDKFLFQCTDDDSQLLYTDLNFEENSFYKIAIKFRSSMSARFEVFYSDKKKQFSQLNGLSTYYKRGYNNIVFMIMRNDIGSSLRIDLSDKQGVIEVIDIDIAKIRNDKAYWEYGNKLFVNDKIKLIDKSLFSDVDSENFDVEIACKNKCRIIGAINSTSFDNSKDWSCRKINLLSSVYLDASTLMLLTENSIFEPSTYIVPKNRSIVNMNGKKIKVLDGMKYILGSNYGYNNYYHVVTQSLPAIYQSIKDIKLENYKLLIPENCLLLKMVVLLGLEEYIVVLKEKYIYKIDKLLYPEVLKETYVTPSKPKLYNNLFNHLIELVRTDKIGSELIYISRLDATKRKMINEDILIKKLQKLGFQIVIPSLYSIEEQIQSFKNARVIVGQHGAGLSNLVFAEKPKYVIELLTDDYINQCFFMLTSLKNCDYIGIVKNVIATSDYHSLEWECDVDLIIAEVNRVI